MASAIYSCLSYPAQNSCLVHSHSVWQGIRSSGGHLHRQALDRGRLQAQKGFGADTGKTKKKQKGGQSEFDDQSWTPVAKNSIFQGKQIKAVELKGKTIVALYNIDGEIFCSDANSTAYQFPLTNAKILSRDGGPAVEVALDGTVYDLQTGKVLEWCPRNNPFRAVLGTLKGNQVPKNLNVYPAKLDEASGQIYVKLD